MNSNLRASSCLTSSLALVPMVRLMLQTCSTCCNNAPEKGVPNPLENGRATIVIQHLRNRIRILSLTRRTNAPTPTPTYVMLYVIAVFTSVHSSPSKAAELMQICSLFRFDTRLSLCQLLVSIAAIELNFWKLMISFTDLLMY